jgi:hypothetical protein
MTFMQNNYRSTFSFNAFLEPPLTLILPRSKNLLQILRWTVHLRSEMQVHSHHPRKSLESTADDTLPP